MCAEKHQYQSNDLPINQNSTNNDVIATSDDEDDDVTIEIDACDSDDAAATRSCFSGEQVMSQISAGKFIGSVTTLSSDIAQLQLYVASHTIGQIKARLNGHNANAVHDKNYI